MQPFCPKPLGGLYSPPYLGEQPSQAAGTLSRAEWWELLFFVRQLEAQEQEEIARLLQRQRAAQVGAEGARVGGGAPPESRGLTRPRLCSCRGWTRRP